MNIYARQGDLVFVKQPVTGDLTPVTNPVLAGNDTAAHTVKGKIQWRQDADQTALRVARKIIVTHAGRHLPIPLVPGDYIVYVLRERGDGFDRKVED